MKLTKGDIKKYATIKEKEELNNLPFEDVVYVGTRLSTNTDAFWDFKTDEVNFYDHETGNFKSSTFFYMMSPRHWAYQAVKKARLKFDPDLEKEI